MENIPCKLREEMLKVLDEIDVNFEEPIKRTRKRSSILKQPNFEDDLTEDCQNKRKSFTVKKRVSFAEKFHVMELNTGNMYDIPGKSDSTLTAENSSSKLELGHSNLVSKSTVVTEDGAVTSISSEICATSSTKIIQNDNKENSNESVLREKKSKNISAEKPCSVGEVESSILKNECSFISEFKNFLYGDDTKADKENNGIELTRKQNDKIRHQNELISQSFSKTLPPLVKDTPVSVNSGNKNNSNKTVLENSVDILFSDKDEYSFGTVLNDASSMNVLQISVSDLPLQEDKENIYIDRKNKNILVANVRNIKLKEKTEFPAPEASYTVLDSQKELVNTGQKDKSIVDKTFISDRPMDLTCIPDLESTSCSDIAESDYTPGLVHCDPALFENGYKNPCRQNIPLNTGCVSYESETPVLGLSQNDDEAQMEFTCFAKDILVEKSDMVEAAKSAASNDSGDMKIPYEQPGEVLFTKDHRANNTKLDLVDNFEKIDKFDYCAKQPHFKNYAAPVYEDNQLSAFSNKTHCFTSNHMDITCVFSTDTNEIKATHETKNSPKIDFGDNIEKANKCDFFAKEPNFKNSNDAASVYEDVQTSAFRNKTRCFTSNHMDITCVSPTHTNEMEKSDAKQNSLIIKCVPPLEMNFVDTFEKADKFDFSAKEPNFKNSNTASVYEDNVMSDFSNKTRCFTSNPMDITCMSSTDINEMKASDETKNFPNSKCSPSLELDFVDNIEKIDKFDFCAKDSNFMNSRDAASVYEDEQVSAFSKNINCFTSSHMDIACVSSTDANEMKKSDTTKNSVTSECFSAVKIGFVDNFEKIDKFDLGTKEPNLKNSNDAESVYEDNVMSDFSNKTRCFTSNHMDITCMSPTDKNEMAGFPACKNPSNTKCFSPLEMDFTCVVPTRRRTYSQHEVLEDSNHPAKYKKLEFMYDSKTSKSNTCEMFDSRQSYVSQDCFLPSNHHLSMNVSDKGHSILNTGDISRAVGKIQNSDDLLKTPSFPDIQNSTGNCQKSSNKCSDDVQDPNYNNELIKCTRPSDSDIVYAIKQVKGINQALPNEYNIFKFPEVYFSLTKNKIPRKSFSCSKIQLAKSVQDVIRQSCSFSYNRSELHLITELGEDQSQSENSKSVHQMCPNEDKEKSVMPFNSDKFSDVANNSPSLGPRSVCEPIRKRFSIEYRPSPTQNGSSIKNAYHMKSLNQSPDTVDFLRRSLNFEEDNAPSIVISQVREESIVEKTTVFLNVTEDLQLPDVSRLDNVCISLVRGDDSLDDVSLKLPAGTFDKLSAANCLDRPVREHTEKVLEINRAPNSELLYKSVSDACYSSVSNEICETRKVRKSCRLSDVHQNEEHILSQTSNNRKDDESLSNQKYSNKNVAIAKSCEKVTNKETDDHNSGTQIVNSANLSVAKIDKQFCSETLIESQTLQLKNWQSRQTVETTEKHEQVTTLTQILKSADMSGTVINKISCKEKFAQNQTPQLNNRPNEQMAEAAKNQTLVATVKASIVLQEQNVDDGAKSSESCTNLRDETKKIPINEKSKTTILEKVAVSNSDEFQEKKNKNGTYKNTEEIETGESGMDLAVSVPNSAISTGIVDIVFQDTALEEQNQCATQQSSTTELTNENIQNGRMPHEVSVPNPSNDLTSLDGQASSSSLSYALAKEGCNKADRPENKEMCEDPGTLSDNTAKSDDEYLNFYYEKISSLRRKFIMAPNKYLWDLAEMDDEQAIFEINPDCIFACYYLYADLEFDSEDFLCTSISFKHYNDDIDDRDEFGFSLFQYLIAEEKEIFPFPAEHLIEKIPKYLESALRAKDLIKDVWMTMCDQSIDDAPPIPKLIVNILNQNPAHFSYFSLTFPLDFKSYPNERIIPEIKHLRNSRIEEKIILNALKQVEPGKLYISRMVKAAKTL